MAASKEYALIHNQWLYSKGEMSREKYTEIYRELMGENPTELPRLYARNFWNDSFVSADQYDLNTGEHMGYIGGVYPDEYPELGGDSKTTAQDYAIYEGDELPYLVPEDIPVCCPHCGLDIEP